MEKVALKAPKVFWGEDWVSTRYRVLVAENLNCPCSSQGKEWSFKEMGEGVVGQKEKKKEKTGEYKRKDKSEKDTEIFGG